MQIRYNKNQKFQRDKISAKVDAETSAEIERSTENFSRQILWFLELLFLRANLLN